MTPRGRHALGVALLGLVALCVRLAHLDAFSRLAFFRLPFGDSLTYVEEARGLLERGPLAPGEPYFQGPLYPLWLMVFEAFGAPLAAVYVSQCLLGSLTVVLIACLASRLVSRRAGLIAGALYALYDAAVFFDVDLLGVSLVTALVALGLWLFSGLLDRDAVAGARDPSTGAGPPHAPAAGRSPEPPIARACLAGAVLALAAWGRPNLLVPLLAIVLFVIRRREMGSRGRVGFVLAAAVVSIAPFLRNVAVSGQPVFLSTSGGVNFYIGNHDGATGTFEIPRGSELANDRRLDVISRHVASQHLGREVNAADASAYWFRRGLRELAAEPREALTLYGRKMLLLLNRREIPNHLELAFVDDYSPVLRALPVRAWLLVPLAVGGAWLLRRRAGILPLIIYAIAGGLSVLPFFVTARYRLPLMPIAAVLAGGFADGLLHTLGRTRATRGTHRARSPGRRMTGAAPSLAWAAVALALSMLPLLPAPDHVMAHVNLGALHADLGELEEATLEFHRALAASPGDPVALLNLGTVAFRRGQFQEALLWSEQALASDPRRVSAWNLRGACLARLQRYDEALESIERALGLFPEHPEAQANLTETWHAYIDHGLERARDAGLIVSGEPESRERLADFFDAQGFHRAAERTRASGGRTPGVDDPPREETRDPSP